MTLKTSNTCLVVLRDKKGKLVFGGDRRISWGHQFQTTPRPKITKRNNVLFAGTGVACLCDTVTDLCHVPDIPKDMDGFHYVHNVLFNSVRQQLQEKGYMDKDFNMTIGKDMMAVILIGVLGDLFEMGITEHGITIDAMDTPMAHGCGGSLALGSLESTVGDTLSSLQKKLKQRGFRGKLKSIEECRIALAIDVAAKHSSGCDSQFDILRED